MLGWIIIGAIIISIGCWFMWSWSNDSLFTYLGEVEITPGVWEACYTYDVMTLPARIVAFLVGVAAIFVFVVVWFGIVYLVM